jgi:hypothetical protein
LGSSSGRDRGGSSAGGTITGRIRRRAEIYRQEEIEIMEINGKVGLAAGQVWEALSAEGPQTVAQLKKKVNGAGEVLNFAIGWLAREDKIEITQDKKSFKVKLK